ncbi:MAG TPA: DUF2672 domain-containing protein [Rickettsia endosymbiont of Sericostoma sp.]|uniref:DUF2672 domain-containing protein n=1 Tax=unclassified Candidatus Tisiphia TaxID=2996318 RepID=UPI001D8F4024|nr:DUF2672 domain-containing protein [Candidatus Tisiphia sp.]HJD63587.1 DUF2672 domain-containing protein [Rickettsia endosymbiont of Sericostoma sp.]
MSIGEILVVMLVAMIVTKPEDIPMIIKKIQEFKLYCSAVKNQALTYITKDLKIDNDIVENDVEQLNFYLERIINIQGYYDGNYSLNELKVKYDKLIKIKSTEYGNIVENHKK